MTVNSKLKAKFSRLSKLQIVTAWTCESACQIDSTWLSKGELSLKQHYPCRSTKKFVILGS